MRKFNSSHFAILLNKLILLIAIAIWIWSAVFLFTDKYNSFRNIGQNYEAALFAEEAKNCNTYDLYSYNLTNCVNVYQNMISDYRTKTYLSSAIFILFPLLYFAGKKIIIYLYPEKSLRKT